MRLFLNLDRIYPYIYSVLRKYPLPRHLYPPVTGKNEPRASPLISHDTSLKAPYYYYYFSFKLPISNLQSLKTERGSASNLLRFSNKYKKKPRIFDSWNFDVFLLLLLLLLLCRKIIQFLSAAFSHFLSSEHSITNPNPISYLKISFAGKL